MEVYSFWTELLVFRSMSDVSPELCVAPKQLTGVSFPNTEKEKLLFEAGYGDLSISPARHLKPSQGRYSGLLQQGGDRRAEGLYVRSGPGIP